MQHEKRPKNKYVRDFSCFFLQKKNRDANDENRDANGWVHGSFTPVHFSLIPVKIW